MPALGYKKQYCLRNHDTFLVGRNSDGGCKACKNIAARTWEHNHPEISRERARNFCRQHPEQSNENNWKRLGVKNADGSVFKYIDRDRAYQIQQGCCKICHKHESTLSKPLRVDHEHNTGIFRGLLCDNCNKMLGHALDSISSLSTAIEYLARSLI